MRHKLTLTLFLILCFNISSFTAIRNNINFTNTFKLVPSDTTETLAIGKKGLGLHISNDSGFIIKKDGLRFLLSISLTDTINSFWEQAKDSDTIGKYYKITESGNFFVCLIDLSSKYVFATHVLFEVKTDGTIINNQRFFHGNYPCCWNNYYEGFYKTDKYFIMTLCGTGSGLCGSVIYVFKEFIPQKEQISIRESYWYSSGEDKFSLNLSSTIEYKDDFIIMHYILEKGKLVNNYTRFKVRSTDRFDVKYILKNGIWEPTDNTNTSKLEI